MKLIQHERILRSPTPSKEFHRNYDTIKHVPRGRQGRPVKHELRDDEERVPHVEK